MKANTFLDKAKSIIADDMSSVNVEYLAKQLKLHPAHVYRKIKSATNYSPSIFIREIRLEKGEELLRTTNMMVKDIAYTVGFNTPSYFIECFRHKHEMTPEEFRRG